MSSAHRISFERSAPACVVCDARPPEGGRLAEVTPPGFPSASRLLLCAGCRHQLSTDGPEPPRFVPEFHFDGSLRLPIVTDDDLHALFDAVVQVAGPAAAAAQLPDSARMAAHESFAEQAFSGGKVADRLEADAEPPNPTDVAGWLLTAAQLGVRAASLDEIERILARAKAGDELALCAAAYAARLAEQRAWHPRARPDERATRRLEWADRKLLAAAPVGTHPLRERVLWMRLAIQIVLGRDRHADALVDRLGDDAPRAQLLRGARLLQRGNVGGAEREFRAAADNPFAGFDSSTDAAALWNRTMRAMTATRVEEARDTLQAYCRAVPSDHAARLLLGHAWLRAARPAVAREVLGSILDATAVDHLHQLATEGGLDETQRTEGRLLYGSCLLYLGELDAARRLLAPEFDGEFAADEAPRPAERLRLAAHVALARGTPHEALDLLRRATEFDSSHALAAEVAATVSSILPDLLRERGITALLEFATEAVWLDTPLLRHYSTAFASLIAMVTLSQIDSGLRPQSGFGLEWSSLSQLGANAISSQYQSCASLVRHQFVSALQHDRRARDAAGVGMPWATLGALWTAAASADPAELQGLRSLLAHIAAQYRPPSS